MSRAAFRIARNPEEGTKLPYPLQLPIDEGLVLKARDTWPRSSRIYCHPYADRWPGDADVIEETPVTLCRRRGAAIDLVLDRPRLARSEFVFTEVRGRPAIFWQTQKTARAANAAIVVEGRCASIVMEEHTPGGWLADVLARLQVRLSRDPGGVR